MGAFTQPGAIWVLSPKFFLCVDTMKFKKDFFLKLIGKRDACIKKDKEDYFRLTLEIWYLFTKSIFYQIKGS